MNDEFDLRVERAREELKRAVHARASMQPTPRSVVRRGVQRSRNRSIALVLGAIMVLTGVVRMQPSGNPSADVIAGEPKEQTFASEDGVEPAAGDSGTEAARRCRPNAVVDDSSGGSNEAELRRKEDFAPAVAPHPGTAPLTKEEAIGIARQLGDGVAGFGQGKSDYYAEAVRQRYEDYAGKHREDPDRLIHPDRCVWAVTVKGPYTVAPPPGVPAPRYSAYEVLFDEASRQMIELRSL